MKDFVVNLTTFICVCFMVVGTVCAATIRIGQNQKVKSIVKGIETAQHGDTIIVTAGLYREGVIDVAKQLVLIGEGYPEIDGEEKNELFIIRAPHVKISGFRIKNAGRSSMKDIAGIKVYNTQHASIQDNVFENNFFAIYVQGSKHCQVKNNSIRSNGVTEQLIGNGIHAYRCDSIEISNNTISGHRDGVYLEYVTHTHVLHNLSSQNLRYGLHFMFSHENSYLYNTFTKNGAGVAVMYTKRVRMEHNVFKENWGDAAYGLLLKDITDSHIAFNDFEKNTTGIFMEGSNRIQIEHNSFIDNGWALKILSSCMSNTLTQNNFIHNTFDISTNGTLMQNSFKKNYWDKYEGYDLDKNGEGDIPYRPVSLFSMIVEKYPTAMLLFRSFMVTLFDRTERIIPSLTPESLKDDTPSIKKIII